MRTWTRPGRRGGHRDPALRPRAMGLLAMALLVAAGRYIPTSPPAALVEKHGLAAVQVSLKRALSVDSARAQS